MTAEAPKVVGESSKRADFHPSSRVGGDMSPESLCASFQDEVRAAVAERRQEVGLRRAFAEIARWYGLTERRVRACWNGEVRTVTAAEWLKVQQRLEDTLLRQEEAAARHLASIQQRRATLRQSL